ncbi:MAG: hypothetical protein U0791_07755 [Gemmataceae bacterium]
MSEVNIFTSYSQEENRFTNGLFSILQLAETEQRGFLVSFLRELCRIEIATPVHSLRVLRDIPGTPDGEILGADYRIWFETKIKSASLSNEQILKQHLHKLALCSEPNKKLVLLTPDDGSSRYISSFRMLDSTRVEHVSWMQVYTFLEHFAEERPGPVHTQLILQFLDVIRDTVFRQDIAGIIATLSFGDHSGVNAETYLEEMDQQGKWIRYRTPKEYKQLSGTRRKLLLYDPKRKAITVVVEISEVTQTDDHPRFPWSNYFADGTLKVLRHPISRDLIKLIPGLETFGKGRSPFRKITHEQLAHLRLENSVTSRVE